MFIVTREVLITRFQNGLQIFRKEQNHYTEELKYQLCTYYLYLQTLELSFLSEDVRKYEAKFNKIELMYQYLEPDGFHWQNVQNYMMNEYKGQRHQNAIRTLKNSFKGKGIFKELIKTCNRLGVHYDSTYIFQFPYEKVLNNHPSSNSIEQVKGRQSAFIIIYKLQQLKEPSQQHFQEFCFKALYPSLRGYNFQTELKTITNLTERVSIQLNHEEIEQTYQNSTNTQ